MHFKYFGISFFFLWLPWKVELPTAQYSMSHCVQLFRKLRVYQLGFDKKKRLRWLYRTYLTQYSQSEALKVPPSFEFIRIVYFVTLGRSSLADTQKMQAWLQVLFEFRFLCPYFLFTFPSSSQFLSKKCERTLTGKKK